MLAILFNFSISENVTENMSSSEIQTKNLKKWVLYLNKTVSNEEPLKMDNKSKEILGKYITGERRISASNIDNKTTIIDETIKMDLVKKSGTITSKEGCRKNKKKIIN